MTASPHGPIGSRPSTPGDDVNHAEADATMAQLQSVGRRTQRRRPVIFPQGEAEEESLTHVGKRRCPEPPLW